MQAPLRSDRAGKVPEIYYPSTGEDVPDEWPAERRQVVREVTQGWGMVAIATGAISLAAVLAWQNRPHFADQIPIARTGSDPQMTGTLKP